MLIIAALLLHICHPPIHGTAGRRPGHADQRPRPPARNPPTCSRPLGCQDEEEEKPAVKNPGSPREAATPEHRPRQLTLESDADAQSAMLQFANSVKSSNKDFIELAFSHPRALANQPFGPFILRDLSTALPAAKRTREYGT